MLILPWKAKFCQQRDKGVFFREGKKNHERQRDGGQETEELNYKSLHGRGRGENKTKNIRWGRKRNLKKDSFKETFTVYGTNAAGLKAKSDSLKGNIENLGVGAFLIQETKLYRKGQIKVENFDIFEQVRTDRKGGGLMIGTHKKFLSMREIKTQKY